MKKNLLITLLLLCTTMMQAQEQRFTIRGELTNDSLRYTAQRVEQLYLKRTIDGVETTVDTATVANGVFTFSGLAPAEMEIYHITGFDNGSIQVFVEPGEITVGPFDARFPVAAKIGGTPCNDVMQGYYDVNSACTETSRVRMKEAMANVPADIKGDQTAEMAWVSPTFYVNNLYFKLEIMNYIYENIESPVALYIIKYSMMPAFTPEVIEEVFLKALPTNLHKHKMYKELVNDIRAANLKEGNIAPDISGHTTDGKELALSDFSDKYILLDFWASTCEKSMQNRNTLKELYQATKEELDKFVIVSLSLDSDKNAWGNALDSNGLALDGWVQGNDTMGTESIAAKQFGVEKTPHMILIDPEGRAISLNMEADEVQMRVEQILDGDLYYLDQSKE